MAQKISRVAVIGAGPAGAITVDALAQEKKFDVIRVFERREKAGGIWINDANEHPKIPSLRKLVDGKADEPIPTPSLLPTTTPQDQKVNSKDYRYNYTPIYPGLVSNIDDRIMSYTKEPFPLTNSEGVTDPHIPFRNSEVIREWVESLLDRKGYRHHVEYNTTVELAEKKGNEWILTLRKTLPGGKHNYWWQETFDAVIVASGHYHIPHFSEVPGIIEFGENHPGAVEHSKMFRGPEKYRGKTVVTIGASVSATDIARSIAGVAKNPVYASIREPHRLFGTVPFEHPQIALKPKISRVSTSPSSRTVYFEDGSEVHDVDHIIFATGYDFSLPFLPSIKIANRRILGTYQHIFKQEDPTLAFVGGVSAGFTFLVFEWQAVLVARFFAGRAQLPSLEEQQRWEKDRLATIGDGQPFYKIAPHFEEYFEALRKLAGEPGPDTPGRRLPKWNPEWLKIVEQTIKNRIAKWKEGAELAKQQTIHLKNDKGPERLSRL
ncbi:hypothetical protein N7495_001898 [Penicillium taxi]|uniref:uncharacterized protein n=1 Tax=Penicillium taxi TaxID=168475 RepID=UPI00254563AF|nr:uncharacterized protein N7495_001898 [Penicillium taxi]KAJ5909216.1 hypothetical protein N7495_001898 [Penicillium taxi]